MVQYRRNFVTGGAYFLGLTLVDRRSNLLIQHVDVLRKSLKKCNNIIRLKLWLGWYCPIIYTLCGHRQRMIVIIQGVGGRLSHILFG